MSWLFWAFAITASSVVYQLSSKLLAGQLPVYFITAVNGAILLIFSCVALALTNQSTAFKMPEVSSRNAIILGCVAIATIGIEVGFNQMYRAGAPIAISRMVTLGGAGFILAVIGVMFFQEKLTIYQLTGIFFTIAGLVMLTMKNS